MENKKLMNKTRIKLTFLSAGITILVLTIMSFLYLSISERNLYNNQFLSFKNSVNTLFFSIEQQTVISHSLLETSEKNGGFWIQIKDNGIDFLYNRRTQSTEMGEAFLGAYNTLSESLEPIIPFSYAGQNYFAAYQKIQKENGFLEVLVLYPLDRFEKQILAQKQLFLGIVCGTSLLLFFLAFFFVGRLLQPIAKSQKNQNQFIASASHELRTPLSVILSCTNACEKATEEEKNTFLKTIETESMRMSRLIADMLTLVKTDYLTYKIEKKNCDPDAVLLNSYEAFLVLAREKALSLDVTLPQDISPPCQLDEERLMQVLSILIQNAISYTPSGGAIHLSRESKTGRIVYKVADTGTGIPDSEKKEIFQKFYRMEKARTDSEHFGLGLSIAHEIVKAHRGTIRVTDTPGGGSTFIVEIPI